MDSVLLVVIASVMLGALIAVLFFGSYFRKRTSEVQSMVDADLIRNPKSIHPVPKKNHPKSHASDKTQNKRHHPLDLNTLKGHGDAVTGLCFSSDGRSLATACADGVIRVFKLDDASSKSFKIISFSQQGPRAICILSANGVISNVTLRQPESCGGTLTYEGRFEILSLSGSFMETTENQVSRGRSGGMSVSLAGPDGRVVGGGVAGLLIAATPIQVVVGSFMTSDQQDHEKQRKQRVEQTPATVMSLPTPPPASVFSSSSNPDREQPPSSFGISSWTNEPRNTATDINISLPAD